MSHDDISILIADQDAAFRQAMCSMLREHFGKVIVAENGPAVLTHCARHDFDLVIVDNRLQGMLGIEVVRRLQQNHPQMRRILISQHDTDPVIESALEYGIIDRFLQKPIGLKALVYDVELLLGLRSEPSSLDDLGDMDEDLDVAAYEDDDGEDTDGPLHREFNYSLPFQALRSR